MTARILLTTAAAFALAAFAGCEQTEPEPADTTGATTGTPSDGTADSPAWLLTSAPADPIDVAAAKTSVSEGDTITLRGRIGGRKDPISADSAVFIVMDPAVPSCADLEGDTCPTPWDYCCEPSESLTANNATVQLVDDEGAPLAINLADHGIEPLDEVIVTGTVAARPNEQTLTVRATRLYRAGS